MAERQYIGARYVPIFYDNPNTGDSTWLSGVAYEPLTIVTWAYNSYTSKKFVPAGVGNPSTNPEYWVNTGNYNAQIEEVRQELEQEMTEIDDRIDEIVNKDITVIFGDSWSDSAVANSVWPVAIQNMIGGRIKNYARNAASFSNGAFGLEFVAFRDDTTYNKKEIKQIIFLGGINDYRTGSKTAQSLAGDIISFIGNVLGVTDVPSDVIAHIFINFGIYQDSTWYTRFASPLNTFVYLNNVYNTLYAEQNTRFIAHKMYNWFPMRAFDGPEEGYFHIKAQFQRSILAPNIAKCLTGGKPQSIRFIDNSYDTIHWTDENGDPTNAIIQFLVEFTDNGDIETYITFDSSITNQYEQGANHKIFADIPNIGGFSSGQAQVSNGLGVSYGYDTTTLVWRLNTYKFAQGYGTIPTVMKS